MTDLNGSADKFQFYRRQVIVGLICLTIVFVSNDCFNFPRRSEWAVVPHAYLTGLMLGEALVTAAWLVLREEPLRLRLNAAGGYVTVWWITALILSSSFRTGQFLQLQEEGGPLVILSGVTFGSAAFVFQGLRRGWNFRLAANPGTPAKRFQFGLRTILAAVTLISVIMGLGVALRPLRFTHHEILVGYLVVGMSLVLGVTTLIAALSSRWLHAATISVPLAAIFIALEPMIFRAVAFPLGISGLWLRASGVALVLTVLAHCLAARSVRDRAGTASEDGVQAGHT